MADDVRIRGIYGKPLLKRNGPTAVQMPLPMLKKAGEIFLKSIKAEIMKDMAKSAGLRGRGKPVPMPDSRKFVDSFSWKISGQSTIEITSNWPTASAHTSVPGKGDKKGSTKPYPMTWLTQPQVKTVPIITQEGRVIFRTAPLTTTNAWIHPGFLRYTFIERGVKKGRVKVFEDMAEEIVGLFLADRDLF
jgi:hypothetical protein